LGGGRHGSKKFETRNPKLETNSKFEFRNGRKC
jgi:hypothetical protein